MTEENLKHGLTGPLNMKMPTPKVRTAVHACLYACVCVCVCACAWARGRGRVRTVCEKRGKKKGNLLCLPSTFFAPVPLFTLPVFSSTLPCLLAVRCPSNRLRQQAVAAAAAAYTRVLYIRPSYSAFFPPPLFLFLSTGVGTVR